MSVFKKETYILIRLVGKKKIREQTGYKVHAFFVMQWKKTFFHMIIPLKLRQII